MIYKREDFFMLSLLALQVDIGQSDVGNRSLSYKFSRSLLYKLFYNSLKLNLNIFDLKKREDFLNLDSQLSEKELAVIDDYLLDELNRNILEERAKNEFHICDIKNIKFVDYLSSKYPIELKELLYPPFLIYYLGNLSYRDKFKEKIAIVGSRELDENLEKIAYKTATYLKSKESFNISGLAIESDTCGHEKMIGNTAAILGQGLASPIYPKENEALAKKIIASGSFVMSEIPPSISVSREFLIERNRLQAALNDSLVVISVKNKSGTKHTVKSALKLGKKVYVYNCEDDFKYIKRIIRVKDIEELKENIEKDKFINLNLF